MEKVFIDIIEEAKNTRSSWKTELIVRLFLNMMETIKKVKRKCLFIVFIKQLCRKPILMYFLMIILLNQS